MIVVTRLSLDRIPIQTLFDIRGASADLDRLAEGLGFPAPAHSGQLVMNASMQWVRFGPSRGFIKSAIDQEKLLENELLKHCSELKVSWVNASDMYCGFLVRGENKCRLLNQIVSVNLHELKPAGAVATEVFELSGILIHSMRNDFEIYVARSYEDYAWNRILRCKANEFENAGTPA